MQLEVLTPVNSPPHLYVYAHIHMCMYVHVSRSEINLGCHSSGVVHLSFFFVRQAGSLTGLELTKQALLTDQ